MPLDEDYDEATSRDKVNPLADLDEAKRTSIDLKFPIEDQTTYHTHHIIFRVFELKRDARLKADKKLHKAEIKLPMTQELQVQYNSQYNTNDLGAVAAAAVGLAEGARSFASDVQGEGFQKAITDAISKINPGKVAAAAIGIVASGAASAAEIALGAGRATAGLAAATGASRNPHNAVLFNGTEFRNHSFQFRLSPVTATESDAIKQIIKVFKWHMHPGYAGAELLGNNFFKNPEFFTIELSHKGAYTVSDYRICVLKGITVNYQPSNYPAYARDSNSIPAPMEVVMNLEFQEIEIITKDVIGSPYQSAALDAA